MRFIRKQAEPLELKAWKQQQAQDSPQNLNYKYLPTEIKNITKARLLEEQGFLCAYTMQRLEIRLLDGGISKADCHIEHVLAQKTSPGQDLDYRNMAACFPKNGGDVSYGYGAPVKGDAPVTLNVDFVSPHHPSCEQRFRYDGKGCISVTEKGDVAAEKTVAMLKLDHSALQDLRRSAIETHGLALRPGSRRTSRKLKSAAEARRFAKEILEKADGRLEPYCVALSQVAEEYADKEEARSRRFCT